MNAIEKLEKYIKDEGITQISGGIFEDQIRKRLIDKDEETGELIYESYEVKANTTVAEYCKSMGSITSATSMGYHGNEEPVSAEEYAKELLAFMTAPGELIVGECKKCFALMTQAQKDVHECDGEGSMTFDEWMNSFISGKVKPFTKKKGDTSGNLREVESIEEVSELARASGKRLKDIFGKDYSNSNNIDREFMDNLDNLKDLASINTDKLVKIMDKDLDKLNEKAIDIAISKGKAKPFKFNDSTKK